MTSTSLTFVWMRWRTPAGVAVAALGLPARQGLLALLALPGQGVPPALLVLVSLALLALRGRPGRMVTSARWAPLAPPAPQGQPEYHQRQA